jgi:hypothetical protein
MPLSVGAGAAENSMLLKIWPTCRKRQFHQRSRLLYRSASTMQTTPRRGCPVTPESGGRPHLTPFALPSDLSALTVSSRSFSAQTLRKEGEAMEIMCRDLFRGLAVVVLAGAASLTLALRASARSQQPAEPAESVVDAARNAREQASNSTLRPKVITNDDLGVLSPSPSASANSPKPSSESNPRSEVGPPA